MVDSVAATIDTTVANGGEIVQPIGADAPEITARFRDPWGKRDRPLPATRLTEHLFNGLRQILEQPPLRLRPFIKVLALLAGEFGIRM